MMGPWKSDCPPRGILGASPRRLSSYWVCRRLTAQTPTPHSPEPRGPLQAAGWIEAFPTTERLLTLLPKYLLNTSFADSASLEPYSQIPGRLSQPASLRSPKVSASPRNCMYPTIPSPRVR
ncbi:uncharacterized protein LOC119864105 isoform X1 [Canis lupus familiaris]|uniref:uncharacterized protein LOC119864105 isoform X1 n=1 Tax=Canis lupus familiaris TaxID=9615 RepID=UPI0018F77D2B|nr:uncharacterized protein LOC119864105 isoform X1 [Canis lupus familiaris]